MVDFKKRLRTKEIEKKKNPIEIYDSLDRSSIAGPLRQAQVAVLEMWEQGYKDKRDQIIKLHTGEGKTLIGLLILQTYLNQGIGPVLYICPNKYLVDQVCEEAKKFGFKYSIIDNSNKIPSSYSNGEKILIINVKKLFNGRSIFGLDKRYAEAAAVVMDDCHACIDAIKGSFTIKANRDSDLYNELFSLFQEEIKEQGEGTFFEIQNDSYDSFLPVPYWSWIDKSELVIQLILKHYEQPSIHFAWPLLKDNIKNCQAFFSGRELEIVPNHIAIKRFSTFHRAFHRILMSATTQDDSFFIKGLSIEPDAIIYPLRNTDQLWAGEKMMIIPSLISESLDKLYVIRKLVESRKQSYGRVALTSSWRKAENYAIYGAEILKGDNLYDKIIELKTGKYEQLKVIVNRYDGIDLPDDSCRILVIDSQPYFHSLIDRYEESCRFESDTINIKLAQKIEQGIGRSVRGEKDYSVIIVIGDDLVKFLRSNKTRDYFSEQTKKQIEIGFKIAHIATEDLDDGADTFQIIETLIKQSIDRDDGWKEFYREKMNEISEEIKKSDIYNILNIEKEFEELSYNGDHSKAAEILQKMIDNSIVEDSEKGWFLQKLARIKYHLSAIDSNQIQISAFKKNTCLLKPKDGIIYKKLEYINENRINSIKSILRESGDYDELILNVKSVIEELVFGNSSERFEKAWKNAGVLLGLLSQRPDNEIKKGPDNLWCLGSNRYIFFECKSEVNPDRKDINKEEAGQMNNHCGWFEKNYGPETKVKRVMIFPNDGLSGQANFTHDVVIMTKSTLKKLNMNLLRFFQEFQKYELSSLTDEKIQEALNMHKLDLASLFTIYYTRPRYSGK